MGKIFQNRRMRPDRHIGSVRENGKVYRERLGLDQYVGSVEFETGKVFKHVRLMPDQYIGHIDQTGGVYAHVPRRPDIYLGRVNQNGELFGHVPRGRDEYIGRIDGMAHPVEGAAAFLFFFYNRDVR